MKKRTYLHLAGDDPAQIFDDLERLRQEQGEQPMAARRGFMREKFARIPYDKALALPSLSDDAWRVVIELDRLIFEAHGQNPVALSSARLRKIGIISGRRMRALRLLEIAGVITVAHRACGKAPLVTYLWLERR